jgi:hypothetical protein
MELKYPRVGSEFTKDDSCIDRVFFRGNRSAKQILEQSKNWTGEVKDDSVEYAYQLDLLGGESCEVFSGCNEN